MKKSTLVSLVINALIFAIYFISGKLGLTLAFANESATAIWPPTGIAIASLLIFGRRVIPAILLGAFLVNYTTTNVLLTSLGIALGNSLEAIAGAFLVKRFANGMHVFERVSDIFKYTFLVSVLSTTISANIGVMTLIFGGLATWSEFVSIWLTWWLGDMGGSLVVAPLILVWWTHHRIPLDLRLSLHFLSSVVAIFLITWLVFYGIVPFPYLFIPIAVWIAFWFGRRGATVATVIVACLTISYTLHGIGPFVEMFIGDSVNTSLVQLQLFLNIFSLTALVFATIVLEIRVSEKTLASHEVRFQKLIEKSFDGVILIDATSKILYSSPSVKSVLGYTPQELLGKTGFDLVAPVDRKMTMGLLAKLVLKPNNVLKTQYRTIRKDNKIIWVEAKGTNLLLEPNVNAVVVNFHDITEEILNKEKLLQEKKVDEAMLGSIGDGIIATDNKGKITMINQAACLMLGWREKELLNAVLIETIPMTDESNKPFPTTDRPLTKVLSLGKRVVTSETVYYVRKDKTKFPVRFNLSPIILNDQVMGTIEVFQDVTKEKEIDKAKTEFVSVASHQLRTPLSIINWSIEELKRTGENFNDHQKKYLGEIYSASKRMITLINALLNASRLELGTVIVEPANVDIIPVVKQVIQDLRADIEKKGITLKETYQENLQPMHADPKLLTIIIQNLLSNGVKYSKVGGTVEIKILQNAKELLISITDDGLGIPKYQESKIFTKLFRADNARAVEPEGTGLGLYIVKEVVESTGGKIWFISEENKGSIFSVSFPVQGMQKKEGKKTLE